jgi:tripartite-type tricarboxylate transporter receptor subunit TctC
VLVDTAWLQFAARADSSPVAGECGGGGWRVITHKFAPGEVTPEQLEKYRQAFDAAMKKKQKADGRYITAYYASCDAETELRLARDIYEWAHHGMVEDGDD